MGPKWVQTMVIGQCYHNSYDLINIEGFKAMPSRSEGFHLTLVPITDAPNQL